MSGKVFIVDDDEAVRDALHMMLEAAALQVETFPSAQEFLSVCAPQSHGCIILDVNMPGMDGHALHEALLMRGMRQPVIFLTGHGTIPATVRAIKAGAIDFLTKPVDGALLLARVREALARSNLLQREEEANRDVSERLALLTEREQEVMKLLISGFSNKEIARHLEISYRTVEIHRAHIMHKTGVSSLLELARFSGSLSDK